MNNFYTSNREGFKYSGPFLKAATKRHEVCSYFHLARYFSFRKSERKIRTRLMWTILIIHDLPAIALLHCELFRCITRNMFLIYFSNIPVNYFLIHQPIVFLYERGLLIYIIYFIRLILFLCSCANFFIILNLPAGVLLIPWLWFFCTLLSQFQCSISRTI